MRSFSARIKTAERIARDRFTKPIKRRFVRLLVSLLSKLDASAAQNLFAANPAGQCSNSAVVPVAAASDATAGKNRTNDMQERLNALPVRREMRTLVVNDDVSIINTDLLAMHLRAIFPGIDAAFMDAIWQRLINKPNSWRDANRLKTTVRSLLSRNKLDISVDESATLVQLIDSHDRCTRENKQAYQPAAKFNQHAVFWPNPTATGDGRSVHEEMPLAHQLKFIDKTTPIGSAGSCFAQEIAYRLQSNGFNYVVTEPAPNSQGLSASCAQWGAIFNTPSFRQLAEQAFGVRQLPRLLWTLGKKQQTKFLDPFREEVSFSSVREYEETLEAHVEAAREALLKTKVFVLTLGVNEVWRIRGDGAVFSRCPWRISPDLVERCVLSVDDNVNQLQRMLDVWRAHNPDVKLIVSVSPVPMHATFRGAQQHVVSANAHSKATLRVAAEKFCSQNDEAYYFPSYESVTYCTKAPFKDDQRHVSRHAVDKVMQLFDTIFVRSEVMGDLKEPLAA